MPDTMYLATTNLQLKPDLSRKTIASQFQNNKWNKVLASYLEKICTSYACSDHKVRVVTFTELISHQRGWSMQ